MLAYLAVTGDAVSRESLTVLLWPDHDPGRARATLRQNLAALNKQLPKGWSESNRNMVRLRIEDTVWVDVQQFRRDIESMHPRDRNVDGQNLETLSKAAQLYRGEFLQGFTLSDSRSFDDWQFFQAESLRSEFAAVLERLVQGLSENGRYQDALGFAQRWLQLDPLAEAVHRQIMRLHAWAGRPSQAKRQYQRCLEILRQELEAEPDPLTRSLAEQIAAGEVSPASVLNQGSASAQPSPGPLAEDRSQAADHAAEPSGVDDLDLYERNTPFIGRSRELSIIAERLRDPACRLLSLTGLGGVGKTRLAIRTAREHSSLFPDGIRFISLVSIHSDRLLPMTLAQSLGLSVAGKTDPEVQLVRFLKDKRLLLILDNFEHLTGAAEFLDRLLSSSPDFKLMVTTRERLQLSSEWLFEVGGLEVPQEEAQENLSEYSAVQLFLQCAQRISASVTFKGGEEHCVARICRLVDGMPLALELAASWLRVLSTEEIVDQIRSNLDFLTGRTRDLPERHRSLRAVFGTSWEILSPQEKSAFQRLSVFQGGFNREAALRVASAGLPQLLRLIDKSLLQKKASGRYEIHPLLSQLAREKLEEDQSHCQDAFDSHCRYYMALLHRQEDRLRGPDQKRALDEIQFEIDNIRMAWRRAVERRMAEPLRQGLEGLHRFYLSRSWFREGDESLKMAAEAFSEDCQLEPSIALTTLGAGVRQASFCTALGAFDDAQRLAEIALEGFRRLGSKGETALALFQLGAVAYTQGDYPRAQRILTESLEIHSELGRRTGQADCLLRLGRVAAETGDNRKALELISRCRDLYREVGDQGGLARSCINQGVVCLLAGDRLSEAEELFRQALAILEKLGDVYRMAACLGNLGLTAQRSGRHRQAKDFIRQALSLLEKQGHLDAIARNLESLGRSALALSELEEAGRCFRQSLERATEIKAIPTVLTALQGAGELFARQGMVREAVQLAEFVRSQQAVDQETLDRAEAQLSEMRPQEQRESGAGSSNGELAGVVRKTLHLLSQDGGDS